MQAASQPEEEWRSIPGFPDYKVSNLGRVHSRRRNVDRILKGGFRGVAHYRSVVLWAPDGTGTGRAVHQLVAEAFIGPRPAGMEVRHLDGDHLNNVVDNLAYGSHTENMLDLVRHGNHHKAKNTHCPAGHEFTPENTYVYRRARACRICSRAKGCAYRQRQMLKAANVPSLAA